MAKRNMEFNGKLVRLKNATNRGKAELLDNGVVAELPIESVDWFTTLSNVTMAEELMTDEWKQKIRFWAKNLKGVFVYADSERTSYEKILAEKIEKDILQLNYFICDETTSYKEIHKMSMLISFEEFPTLCKPAFQGKSGYMSFKQGTKIAEAISYIFIAVLNYLQIISFSLEDSTKPTYRDVDIFPLKVFGKELWESFL